MEIDPFIFRLSIFYFINIYWLLCCWSVTPSLHTPLMSVTNAISSVIIVGAIIAALAASSESVFNSSSIFGFTCNYFSSSKYFWRFFGNSKNAPDVQKKER